MVDSNRNNCYNWTLLTFGQAFYVLINVIIKKITHNVKF